jgi:predicted PurR-regulated permease PerM
MSGDPQPAGGGVEKKLAAGVLLALGLGCGLVLWPFLSAAIWAVVLCISSWPLYTRLLGWCRQRRTVAAGMMAAAMVLVVLLPFVVVGMSVGDNIQDLTRALKEWQTTGGPPAPAWLAKLPGVGPAAVEKWEAWAADGAGLRAQAGQLAERLGPQLLQGAVALGAGLMQLGFSILIVFFLFQDGGGLGSRVLAIMGRIAGPRGQHLTRVACDTVRSVVYGILGTALVQGVATGLGVWIAGVPNVALLALLAFFSAVVPMAGPALVWLPAALWLFAQGATKWGVFLVVWGVAVNNIDNVLKPYLISQGSDLPFILIFLGVLGGAMAFGFIGVFLGPTLLAVGYRLVVEWNAEKPA